MDNEFETLEINPDLGLELEVTGEEIARDAIIDDGQVEDGIDFDLSMVQADVSLMGDDLVQDSFNEDCIEDLLAEDTTIEIELEDVEDLLPEDVVSEEGTEADEEVE